MDQWYPTDEELATLPCEIITPDTTWDPSSLDNEFVGEELHDVAVTNPELESRRDARDSRVDATGNLVIEVDALSRGQVGVLANNPFAALSDDEDDSSMPDMLSRYDCGYDCGKQSSIMSIHLPRSRDVLSKNNDNTNPEPEPAVHDV